MKSPAMQLRRTVRSRALLGLASSVAACLAITLASLGQERGAELIPPPVSVVAESVGELAPGGDVRDRLLTLDELLEMALDNNPAIATAAARVEAARGAAVQAGLWRNPTIGYLGSEMGNEGRAGQQGIVVGQTYIRGGKLALDQAVAAQEVVKAEQQLAAMRKRVETDVRTAYYDLLVAQRRMTLAKRLVSVATESEQKMKERRDKDKGTDAEVHQSRVERRLAELHGLSAQAQRDAAWRELAALVGLPNMNRPEPDKIKDDLSNGVSAHRWEEVLDRVLGGSPEMAAAFAEVERARLAVRRAEVEPIPNIDFQASVQYDHATSDTYAGLQASVPIPIYNANQGGIAKARAEVAAAESEIRRVDLGLRQRLAGVYRDYDVAREQASAYSTFVLPEAEKALDVVKEQLDAGRADYWHYATAQRTYFQTNLDYLEIIHRLRKANAAIDGLLLDGSLKSPTADR